MSQYTFFGVTGGGGGLVNSVTGQNGVDATPTTGNVVVSGINATTSQIGVVILATNAETIDGSDTTKVTTPDDIKAKLGAQTVNGLAYGNGQTNSLEWLPEATDGQIPIGDTGGPPILGLITSLGGTIDWTFGPGTINGEVVDPTQEIALNYVNVTNAMSPYVVTTTDYYISVDSSAGPVTILLPNTTTFKRQFVIKDRVGQSATNNVTVTTVGGAVNIDGATSYTFTDNFESLEILFNALTYETF